MVPNVDLDHNLFTASISPRKLFTLFLQTACAPSMPHARVSIGAAMNVAKRTSASIASGVSLLLQREGRNRRPRIRTLP